RSPSPRACAGPGPAWRRRPRTSRRGGGRGFPATWRRGCSSSRRRERTPSRIAREGSSSVGGRQSSAALCGAQARAKMRGMLRHSFVHCPGIGLARERTLWERGYVDWDAFLDRHPAGGWRDRVAERLTPERAARELPRREAWRLLPECAGSTLYLDLETD